MNLTKTSKYNQNSHPIANFDEGKNLGIIDSSHIALLLPGKICDIPFRILELALLSKIVKLHMCIHK